MHGLIYQISDVPVAKDDYIESSELEEGDLFDYCSEVSAREMESAINSLPKELPATMFSCNKREITFLGGDKQFIQDWQVKLHKQIEHVQPEDLAEGRQGTTLYLYQIEKILENVLGTSVLFVDKDYNGCYPVKSTDFLFDCIARFSRGDKFYIGGILDYHF